MKTSDFYYDLPEELIAQTPAEKRDHSRLMVLSLKDGSVTHRRFYDICDYFKAGDCLVLNDTKVLPARLYAQRKGGTAPVEILLLKDMGGDVWECIVKPGKKLREGAEIYCGNDLSGVITDVLPDGNRLIKFSYDGIFLELL
ncbi:MAG: S-adenosylmethionine:tRNA ribosyltransferase-isomerase, partial [Clostridia bacterium]|nr:S-adenosylmethionine:tRNA ribosyltransferase-isomerase [Clostridia bacterium]